jgi:hypothetical protein
MAAEITLINTEDLTSQIYESQEVNLIPTFDITTSFTTSSYIELFVYDLNQNILTTEYNFTQYNVLNNGQSAGSNNELSQIEINPEQVLLNLGFDTGEYITYFNFLNKHIGSNIELLYISEISADRTEIRLDSTILSDLDIIEKTNTFIQERNSSTYFFDFYINLGDNNLFIANNIALTDEDTTNPTILIKLYEPLPEEYDLNSTLWVISSIEESIAYQVTFLEEPIIIQDTTPIKGPNFNLDLKDQINNSTLELNYTDIITTSLTSSQNEIFSLLEEKEIDINIDYTDLSEFIHFSSAQTRLENFYHKIQLIEEYNNSISILNSNITGPTSSSLAVNESKTVLEAKISKIITNFDGWDYYLYYSSGSKAWPKLNTEPPYLLAPSVSNEVLTWFGSTNEYSPLYGGLIFSASIYDEQNKDNLLKSIPEYLRDDPSNENYELFIDMVAQHFDNIWIYYKDVTQKYNADNRLEYGISKDIVADAIRDFGVKLYQNNFSNQDLYTAFLGLTPDGALFPFPNITGSLPAPSGFEYIDTLISASNDYMPLDDVNKSLYKRIYHNLPYLLKSKGTLPGLRALITSYGIPDTILRINEYGGKDKVNSNDWDYWQNEFNYAFYSTGSNYITTPWELNSNWTSPDNVPASVAFRFKTNGLPQTNIPYSQSLWYLTNLGNDVSHITLTYTGSGYTSGSYSGSIIDPYYQYATLTFFPDAVNYPNSTASVYLPFFDDGWWSVMVNRQSDDFSLYVGNKIYEGGDNGTLLGFFTSASITEDSTLGWSVSTNGSVFARGSNTLSYPSFSGSLQEIRYYTNPISESIFKDYIMNPYSIEGNSLNSGPNELAFRAPLGGELYTGSVSIHPKVTGSWVTTSSFASNSNFNFNSTPTFAPNTEYFFYDQPVAGIKNAISDKIRIENNTLPTGSVLSPLRSLSQTIEASASYTPNINLLEVTFSPQDEINDDINSSLGFFNLGDYIGDPAFRSSPLQSYPDLDNLRNNYFEKYTKNYNLFDYIRLIKFFDNSLFKMIKDFVPARTSLASGVTIKQHLLERNRYPQPQVDWSNVTISGTVVPQWNDYNPGTIENFSGGTGGSVEEFNYVGNVSQSWNETYATPLGEVTVLHNSQEEFYDGEFSGSVILVTTQSLSQPYPLENASFEYTPILYRNSLYGQNNNSTFTEGQFLNSLTTPNQGEILILAPRYRLFPLPLTKGPAFIKINKIDVNGVDNTIALGQLTNLLIKYTTNTSYENYEVLNINEHSNYYLYEINRQDIPLEGLGIDNEIKNYRVSSSITGSSPIPSSLTAIGSWNVTSGNIAHYGTPYFNTSSGVYTLENTPNISLRLTASITTSGSSTGTFGYLYSPVGGTGVLNFVSFGSGANVTSTITASFDFRKGDFFALVYGATSSTLKSGSLLITQSISPTASVQDSIIVEPYITQPNFYNSDQNPLINNANIDRISGFYQDVDYSSGVLTPTNFDLLINNEATRAAVQDSNYTTLRHINPRYNGSKTTSQELNKWTLGDEGTYSKLPSVESLKTYVAYSDSIGGYAPEKMNTSGVSVKYLISEDGDLIAPNTTLNSLSLNQQTFVSREKVELQSLTAGGFTQNPKLNIFRGGASIEPIIYNQIRHYDNPPMDFTQSLTFTDRNPYSSASISDFTATKSPDNGSTLYPVQTAWSGINLEEIISSGSSVGASISPSTSTYTVFPALVAENLDLIFEVNLNAVRLSPGSGTVFARVVRNRGGVITSFPTNAVGGIIVPPTNPFANTVISTPTGISKNINFTVNIPRTDLQVNDVFGVQMIAGQTGTWYANNSTFKVSTNPYPTPPLNISNLFFTSSSPGFENYLYSSNNTFIQYLNSSNIYQEDIPNSGFFPITLPVTIQPGDEFRFEGDETKTFMVSSATIIKPLSIPLLRIILDKPISGSNINVNEFLLRRYVDNPAGLLLDGLKPSGFNGPYIIKPEYMSEKMEQNIGKYIEDFTNKGLL